MSNELQQPRLQEPIPFPSEYQATMTRGDGRETRFFLSEYGTRVENFESGVVVNVIITNYRQGAAYGMIRQGEWRQLPLTGSVEDIRNAMNSGELWEDLGLQRIENLDCRVFRVWRNGKQTFHVWLVSMLTNMRVARGRIDSDNSVVPQVFWRNVVIGPPDESNFIPDGIVR